MRITSLSSTGKIQRYLDDINAKNWLNPEKEEGVDDNWIVDMVPWDYIHEATLEMERRDKKMDIIYLTADAEDELETIDNNTIYILGGLLDHNRLKMATYERANSKNIKTARLPLQNHVHIQRRHILTVNHVFDILLTYPQNPNWQEVFLSQLPSRMEPIPIEDKKNTK